MHYDQPLKIIKRTSIFLSTKTTKIIPFTKSNNVARFSLFSWNSHKKVERSHICTHTMILLSEYLYIKSILAKKYTSATNSHILLNSFLSHFNDKQKHNFVSISYGKLTMKARKKPKQNLLKYNSQSSKYQNILKTDSRFSCLS